jgi:hypothetical protein
VQLGYRFGLVERGADFGDKGFLLGINKRVKEVLFECYVYGCGEVPDAILLGRKVALPVEEVSAVLT